MRENIIARLSEITEEERAVLQGAPVDLSWYKCTTDTVIESGHILPQGRLFGIHTHTRFVDFPRHSHSYVELIYQIQGSTTHIVDAQKEIKLHAGNLLFLGRGTEHAIRAAGRKDIAINFVLVPAFFDNVAISMGGGNALSIFLKNNLGRSPCCRTYLMYDISGEILLENLLENLILLELDDVTYQHQQLQQQTLELLLRHLSSQTSNLVVVNKEDREHAIVLSALARIESDVKCSLTELASEYKLEVPALSRLIHRHTGCTFTELLHTVRFNRAITLLTETNLSITDVATTVGYENTAFFYRRFFERFGCTPGEFRANAAHQ